MLKESQCNRVTALHITTRFNLAFYYEQVGQTSEAFEIYSEIIKQEPTYTDAYLRLAYMAQAQGDTAKALGFVD